MIFPFFANASPVSTDPQNGDDNSSTTDLGSAQCPVRAVGGPTCEGPIEELTGSKDDQRVSQCPVKHDPDAINPHNNMPVLSQVPLEGQTAPLPTSRATSSIPRSATSVYPGEEKRQDGDAPAKWEYPSPQQFFNALIRKGWNMPEEHAVSMVVLHNRLNEYAWKRVVQWEARFQRGGPAEASKLELSEFSGIHGHLSFKANLYQLARRLFPTYFTLTPPFDRHDWIVHRPGTGKKVRYVIDYYSSRTDPDSEPTFHLDVRPASDSVDNIRMRVQRVIVDNASTVKVVALVVLVVIASYLFRHQLGLLLYGLYSSGSIAS